MEFMTCSVYSKSYQLLEKVFCGVIFTKELYDCHFN